MNLTNSLAVRFLFSILPSNLLLQEETETYHWVFGQLMPRQFDRYVRSREDFRNRMSRSCHLRSTFLITIKSTSRTIINFMTPHFPCKLLQHVELNNPQSLANCSVRLVSSQRQGQTIDAQPLIHAVSWCLETESNRHELAITFFGKSKTNFPA